MEIKDTEKFSTNFFGYNKNEVDKVLFNLLDRIKILESDLNFLKVTQNNIAQNPKFFIKPKLVNADYTFYKYRPVKGNKKIIMKLYSKSNHNEKPKKQTDVISL